MMASHHPPKKKRKKKTKLKLKQKPRTEEVLLPTTRDRGRESGSIILVSSPQMAS